MNSSIIKEPDANPRQQFDAAVDYAIQVANVTLNLLKQRRVAVDGLQYLEIGPGADFAPQLILASTGARVTLVDKFLAPWDPDFHPDFAARFWKSRLGTRRQSNWRSYRAGTAIC